MTAGGTAIITGMLRQKWIDAFASEQEHHATSARLAAALDQVDIGIVLLDADTRAEFINRAFRDYFSLPDEKADSKPPFIALMYHGRDTGAYELPEEELNAFIAERTQAENVAYFEREEVTIGPIYDIAQIVEDPHVLERELIADYPDPDMGAFPMHHVVPRLSGTPGAIRAPAPKLGEHNRDLLAEVGVDEAAYAKLLASGVACEGGIKAAAKGGEE